MTTANDELIQEIINILEKRVEGSNPKDLEYEYSDGESLDLVADLLVEAGYTIFGITKDDNAVWVTTILSKLITPHR